MWPVFSVGPFGITTAFVPWWLKKQGFEQTSPISEIGTLCHFTVLFIDLKKSVHGVQIHTCPLRSAGYAKTYGDLQDLKDFARQSGLDVVYSEIGRERDGKG